MPRRTLASVALTSAICFGAALAVVGRLDTRLARDLDDVAVDADSAAFAVGSDAFVGHVLVASASVADPDFAGSVVYVVHHDAHGAVGVVLNRPVGRAVYGVPLYTGGPVGAGSVIVLHDNDNDGDGIHVETGVVAAGHDPALMQAIAAGHGPAHAKAFVGYAGWGPGQLEREVATGAWSVVDVDAALVFGAF